MSETKSVMARSSSWRF